jgi:hypothetical protein
MEIIIPWKDGNGNIRVTITYEEEGFDGVINITSDTSIEDFETRTQILTIKTIDGSISRELKLTQIGKYIQVYSEEINIGNEVYEDNSLVYVEATGNEYTNYGSLLRSAVTLDEDGNEIILLRIDENGNLRSTN